MIPVAAVLLLAGASCTSDGLDDGTGADVVLEILGLQNPPVTAALATTGSCSTTTATGCMADTDCPVAETCVFGCVLTVVDWTAEVAAQPKNTLAAPIFNDIVMIDVTLTYDWLNGTVMPQRTFGLGSVAVPAGGSSSVTFAPLAFNDLSSAILSSTANLTLNFRARTVEGTNINTTVLRSLNVEVCQ
jgi:hypothetical protein